MEKSETNKILKLGDAYDNPKNFSGGRGTVFDTNGICGTIVTMRGGGNKPMIIVAADTTAERDDCNEQD